jgi:hypothetical protein
MIFSSSGVLQYAMSPILLDDPAHYRPTTPAFEVSKESAGKRHLMVCRHLSGARKESQ